MQLKVWIALAVLVLSAMLVLTSCGGSVYAVSRSPQDEDRRIEVVRAPFWQVEVKLVIASERKTLVSKSDAWPQLTEVNWAPDGTVGVLVCAGAAGPIIAGYDLAKNEAVGPEQVIPGLKAALQKRYGLSGGQLESAGGDPVKWACRSAGEAAWQTLSWGKAPVVLADR
jgi:hypothetical protein